MKYILVKFIVLCNHSKSFTNTSPKIGHDRLLHQHQRTNKELGNIRTIYDGKVLFKDLSFQFESHYFISETFSDLTNASMYIVYII